MLLAAAHVAVPLGLQARDFLRGFACYDAVPGHLMPCHVQLKLARTGAWSLVPTSFWTGQAIARAANEVLANT